MTSRSSFRKIGIVVNKNKPSALKLLKELKSWLAARSLSAADTTSSSLKEVMQDANLMICLGGDGTILYLATHMKKKSIPVLGINLGSLGFLTEVKQNEMFDELKTYLSGRALIEERLMISCEAKSSKIKKTVEFTALNDIVVSREGLSRMVSVEVSVNEETLTHFSGDGVIVATPTGSTAYSLSAGGSVVHPKLEALIVTPICPHASSLRSMVLSARERISVRLRSKVPRQAQDDGERSRTSGESKALLTADGQENLEIDDSYVIEITRSSTPLKLVKSSKRNYFVTLRENFKFPV